MGLDSDQQPVNEGCVATETKEPESLRGQSDVNSLGASLPALSVIGWGHSKATMARASSSVAQATAWLACTSVVFRLARTIKLCTVIDP